MIDEIPADFVDLVDCFREERCEFLIVGAHALAAHGAPRATGDLDVFVRPAAGRAKDLADVETLEEIRARQRA